MNKTILAAIAGTLIAQSVAAAEITVLSGGAIEPGLRPAVEAFQKETGHKVKLSFNTAPQILKRVGGGETWDVVIAPPSAIEEFAKTGKVGAERIGVGRVGMGVVVRPGAASPDLSNAEALKRSILAAESLVFNRASTGIYFEGVLRRMGIYDTVERKITRYADGASVMEHVLKGKGRELGFGAITEILLAREKGLRLVGPLPAEVQNYTAYTATLMAGTHSAEVAQAFVQYLGSPAGKAILVAAGVE